MMKVKELFSDESKWTQGALAEIKKHCGVSVDVFSPMATCWCLSGAIIKCYDDPYSRVTAYNEKVEKFMNKLGII